MTGPIHTPQPMLLNGHSRTYVRGIPVADEVLEDGQWMTPLLAWLTGKWAGQDARPVYTGVLGYLGEQQ